MKRDILKVRVIEESLDEFEKYCNDNDIYFRKYPVIITGVYRVECKEKELSGIVHCLKSVEPMPTVTLA